MIINDGSTDNTENIIKEYESKYPNIYKVVTKINGGWGSTLNTSIKIASGKYFKQLDGDDWFDTNNLEVLINRLENIDSDIIINNFTRINVESGTITIADYKNIVDEQFGKVEDFCEKEYLEMPALTIKTEILKKYSGNITENCFYTDVEYAMIPVVYSNNYYKIPIDIYYYRIGNEGQSVSLKNYIKRISELETVYKKLASVYLNEGDTLSVEKKKYIKKKLDGMLLLIYRLYTLCDMNENRLRSIKDFDFYLKANNLYTHDEFDLSVKIFCFNKFRFARVINGLNKLRYKGKL